jgi:hypothetical protein
MNCRLSETAEVFSNVTLVEVSFKYNGEPYISPLDPPSSRRNLLSPLMRQFKLHLCPPDGSVLTTELTSLKRPAMWKRHHIHTWLDNKRT